MLCAKNVTFNVILDLNDSALDQFSLGNTSLLLTTLVKQALVFYQLLEIEPV